MFRKQLITHITHELSRGVSQETITAELLFDGWPQEDISEAFEYAMRPELIKTFSFHRFLSTEVPAWIEALTLCLAFVALSSVIAYFVYFEQKVYSYEISVPPKPDISKNILRYGAQPTLSDRNFFNQVQSEFIAEKVDFLLADLARMKLTIYKKGKIVDEVSILTKGKEGSWWETPAGLYKIETKEKTHFSSFGKVYQPWSMAFQGNFFIHGWPYYPDGKNVESTYSGGCIRLSSEDAQKVYEASLVGMPVLVYEKDFASDGRDYTIKRPNLSATHYLAADLKSDFVFLEKNDHAKVPIASLAKLMTALVATEYFNLEKKVTVTESMIVPTSKTRLKVGESLTAYQLLYPMLLESSNEAAEALSQLGGRRADFIASMNEKAASIGMKQTVFTDPSGRDSGNVSSIDDLFLLAKYLYHNRSFILRFTSGDIHKTAYGSPQWSNLENFNDFADDPEFVGGKVGESTPARQVEISVFEREHGGEVRPFVFIVLGSPARLQDLTLLRSFVWNSFE